MTKEELRHKVEFIEQKIECNRKIREFDRKDNRRLIFLSILTFIGLLLLDIVTKDLSTIHVFSISLFTVSTYDMLKCMCKRKVDNEFELRCLKIDLAYYKSVLGELEGE